MNISYNWLKDLIEIDLAPDALALALTRVGLAVEGVHPRGDDFVLDVDLTSNRPDCLSHLGVARELRVITNLELKIKNFKILFNAFYIIISNLKFCMLQFPLFSLAQFLQAYRNFVINNF